MNSRAPPQRPLSSKLLPLTHHHFLSISPPPFLRPRSKTPFSVKVTVNRTTNFGGEGSSNSSLGLSISTASSSLVFSEDRDLLFLLRQRKTEEAFLAYTHSPQLPNPTCLSRLVAQLSHQNTPVSIQRAQSIVNRLRQEKQLHRLDANSLDLLAVGAAKAGQILYAASIIKSMIRSNYLPNVKAWSAVVSRLASSPDDGPLEAVKLFSSVVKRVKRFADRSLVVDSLPDTAAYNAVLNACANIGDTSRFVKLFDEMREFNAEPDVLTYNIMIKLCARVDRKDLIVFVLERIVEKGIKLCLTTLNSLVSAYVGFGDLETAEKLVQAMRERRSDICKVLRECNGMNAPNENGSERNSVFDKLLPNSVDPDSYEPPLLEEVFCPDTRMYTTLMKGYMNEGRSVDAFRVLEAMRCQTDGAIKPDHVTYTTLVSAFVKSGSMDKARQVLAEMTRVGVPANRITYNILLKGYCQQLQFDKARELMKDMSDVHGIEPDVVSYNTMIDGCLLVDDSAGALAYFNAMRSRGIAPTKVSYTILMKSFVLSGQPKLANQVFDEMLQDPRVKVDLVAWNVLVEGYCRLGKIDVAKRIIQRMRDNGFYPNAYTYGCLANGILLAKKPGEALLLWSEIKERCEVKSNGNSEDGSASSPPPFTPDEGLLNTLAEICVRAAFFKRALEIVACMEKYGLPPDKTKFTKIYVEMHSMMFTSKHASQARIDRRAERKRTAEAFKFWLGLPNSYYGSEWRLEPVDEHDFEI